MIKERISERLEFVMNTLKESSAAEQSGNTYHAACLTASARDSLAVLSDNVNGLACALSDDGYDNAYFNDLDARIANLLDRTVMRLETLENSLKG